MQQRLTDLAFDPGPVDDYYGSATIRSVWAFKKLVLGIPREDADGTVTPEVWERMFAPVDIAPRRTPGGRHLEVYLPEQVAVLFADGAALATAALAVTTTGDPARTRRSSTRRRRLGDSTCRCLAFCLLLAVAAFLFGARLPLPLELVLDSGVGEPLLLDALEVEDLLFRIRLEGCPRFRRVGGVGSSLLQCTPGIVELVDRLVVVVGLHEL